MNLITQKQLADLAGVSSPAITKARKKDRLEYYRGTKVYDTDSPLNRAFLETIPKERLNKPAVIPTNGEVMTDGIGRDLGEALTEVQHAQAKKLIEEAELKKQQRIEKELRNAARRGELVELESINISLMTFLDELLNTNKRYFNAAYDKIVRETLTKGEKVEGLKQDFLNEMELSADEAKQTVVKKLTEIQIDQAKR